MTTAMAAAAAIISPPTTNHTQLGRFFTADGGGYGEGYAECGR